MAFTDEAVRRGDFVVLELDKRATVWLPHRREAKEETNKSETHTSKHWTSTLWSLFACLGGYQNTVQVTGESINTLPSPCFSTLQAN